MGYFSNMDIAEKYNYTDREDISDDLKEQMVKIITLAFPEKSYFDLFELGEANLRGLYGQAKRKLNLAQNKSKEDIDSFDYMVSEYEDYSQGRR